MQIKKVTFSIILIIIAIFIFPKPFTLMLYICGDNNLSGAVNGDIDEIENAYGNLTSNLDIVICVDGDASNGGYDDVDGNHSDLRYYHLSGGGDGSDGIINESAEVVLGELNMSDPQTLINFVDWAQQNYPADEYGLIIWDHGAGWTKTAKGGISDDTDNDFMSTAGGEWRQAILGARAKIGQDFYFIGHDLCVMAYMEVLWDEYDVAEMIVGSEANEPFDGWCYDSFITSLAKSNPNTHAELGHNIVTDYANYYGTGDATMTYNVINDAENFNGISEDRFLQLRDHIVWLAYYLIMDEGGRDDIDVQSCIDNTIALSSGTLYEDFKDLWYFCDLLENYTKSSKAPFSANVVSEAQAVKTIIEEMNPEHYQSGFQGSKGLGIYLPDGTPYSGFEAPYDASTHPWGGQDAIQWTDFIYGRTTTTPPTNYSTAINNAQASMNIDNNTIIFNYEIKGMYTRIEIFENNKKIYKDYNSGSYSITIDKPGVYEYELIVYSTDNSYKSLLKRKLYINKGKPVIRNGTLYKDNLIESISIISIDGRKILNSNNNTVDLSNLNKGIYYIKADKQIYKLLIVDKTKMFVY